MKIRSVRGRIVGNWEVTRFWCYIPGGGQPTESESLKKFEEPASVVQRSALIVCDRLPKLDAISVRIGEPAKLSEVIALAFWIDRDPFSDQTVQNTIQIFDLEIDHCFLCRREVVIVLFEEGKDDLRVLRRGRKRVGSVSLHQTKMLLIPLIKSFRIICSQKYTAEPSN